jgi:DNA-binding transcriptional MerR regulator
MLQESGFALKEIVAALQPQLDPHGNITYLGQEMARKIYKALEDQRTRLTERQKEVALAIDEISHTMKHLTDCFGCKIAGSLEECAKCEAGAADVIHLSRQFVEAKHTAGQSIAAASQKLLDNNAARAANDAFPAPTLTVSNGRKS